MPPPDIRFAETGPKTAPSAAQRDDGWTPGQKPEAEVMNYMMNAYWKWALYLESLIGIIEQTIDDVKISVTTTLIGSDLLVSGVITFDTDLKSDKSIVFTSLPDPVNGSTIVLKSGRIEANFSPGQKLNLIRRAGWLREFSTVGAGPKQINVYNSEVFIVDNIDDKVYVFDLEGNPLRNFASGAGTALSMKVYNNEIFTISAADQKIYVVDLFGNALRNFTTGIAGPGALDIYDDEIYIINATDQKIYVTDLVGAAVRNFASGSSFIGKIKVYNDEIYIIDKTANLIYVTDLVGVADRNFASGGSNPTAIDVFNDEVFIGDDDDQKVYVTELDGTALRNFASGATALNGVSTFNDEVYIIDVSTDVIFVKSIFTDDTTPAEAYKLKTEVPFAYIGEVP